MQLSEENRKTLLINIHKLIEETANATASEIYQGKLDSIIMKMDIGLSITLLKNPSGHVDWVNILFH